MWERLEAALREFGFDESCFSLERTELVIGESVEYVCKAETFGPRRFEFSAQAPTAEVAVARLIAAIDGTETI